MQHPLGDRTPRRIVGKLPIGLGDECRAAHLTIASRECGQLQVQGTADRMPARFGQLPMMFILREEATRNQLASIGIGGKRARTKLVWHKVIGPTGIRFLTVQEQQFLKVEVARRTTKRI
jgi:hypothetical protein